MLTIMCILGNYWPKHYFNFTENETSRSKWVVDYEMPIITQDREYVEKWVRLDG